MIEVQIPRMHEPRPVTGPGGRIRWRLVFVAVALAGLAGAALATLQSSGHGRSGDDHAVRDRGEWRAMPDEADDSTRRALDSHPECVLIIEESPAFERVGVFATLSVAAHTSGVRQP